MGKKKVRAVRDGGDEGLAQMAHDEGACEYEWPAPNWDAVIPIVSRAMREAKRGELTLLGIDGVLAELRPHVPIEETCLLGEYRTELERLAKKALRNQAKKY